MLTAALSNTSCCSSRPTAGTQKTEAAATLAAAGHTESRSEAKRETTLETTTEGVTVTEVEIYDTAQPKDPETGLPPVKARVRQRHDSSGTSRTVEQTAATATAESDNALEYDGGELSEVTVTATKAPGLWERMKQGAAWAAAITILAAAGWIVYKIKKRKKT